MPSFETWLVRVRHKRGRLYVSTTAGFLCHGTKLARHFTRKEAHAHAKDLRCMGFTVAVVHLTRRSKKK